MYYISIQGKNEALLKHLGIICLMGDLSLVGIGDMTAKLSMFVDEGHGRLAAAYWLPILYKNTHYKSRIVKQFVRGTVLICFGLLGVRAGFLLDWNLMVCLHIIFLFSALQCLVVWSERG